MTALSLSELQAVNSFAALPETFYTRLAPRGLNNPRLLHANSQAAALIGLDPSVLTTPEFLQVFFRRPAITGRRYAGCRL